MSFVIASIQMLRLIFFGENRGKILYFESSILFEVLVVFVEIMVFCEILYLSLRWRE